MEIEIIKDPKFVEYLKLNGYDDKYIKLIYNHKPFYENIHEIYLNHYIKSINEINKEIYQNEKECENNFNIKNC